MNDSSHPKVQRLLFVPELSNETQINYFETLMHLQKSNIGIGIFAMGYAFKNGGILIGPVFTLLIAIIGLHCQHLLINCADTMSSIHFEGEKRINYVEAIELCFQQGPPRIASVSKIMGMVTNFFIFIIHMGICCVHLTIMAANTQQIFKSHNVFIEIHYMVMICWVPVWITCLLTTLKALAPVSVFGNFCMLGSFILTIYFALKDGLPEVKAWKLLASSYQLGIFFGTVIFCFESITVTLPFKNAMKNPRDFAKPFGVLNVSNICMITMYLLSGFCGYIKWGDDVSNSLTLNIGLGILAECTRGLFALGIMFSYPLKLFIPISMVLPSEFQNLNCGTRQMFCGLLLRTGLSFITVFVAAIFLDVGIFISLIGGFCSTVLGFIFPPIMECLLLRNTIKNSKFLKYFKIFKNCIILMIAFLSFIVGTFVNIMEITNFL